MEKLILTVVFVLLVAACNDSNVANIDQTTDSPFLQLSNKSPLYFEHKEPKELNFIQEIENEIYSFKEIYDAVILQGKKEILVTYKVRHLQRFRLKKIEKELSKALQKRFPNKHFVVSSDYKIHLEATRLGRDMNKENLSAEEAEKRLQKIIKLKKELT